MIIEEQGGEAFSFDTLVVSLWEEKRTTSFLFSPPRSRICHYHDHQYIKKKSCLTAVNKHIQSDFVIVGKRSIGICIHWSHVLPYGMSFRLLMKRLLQAIYMFLYKKHSKLHLHIRLSFREYWFWKNNICIHAN
jgi:hypothetical protein